MIRPGSVKICSLRRPEHAEMVVAAGADAFGLIFVESAWRRVDVPTARSIVDEVRRLCKSQSTLAVGVFLGSDVDEINRVADQTDLDLVQMHFPEIPADLDSIERPIIATLRPVPGTDADHVREQVRGLEERRDRIAGILIDAYSPSGNGGLGELADWDLGAKVAKHHKFVLAGGLTPESVAGAIRSVRPIGVDVSSGVETDREKDPVKIAAFVGNAKAAFAEQLIRDVDQLPVG